MTTLVLGSDGQLGLHLRNLLPTATLWTRRELDLARVKEIPDALNRLRPTAIVNAAAYTAVDRAESEPDLAWMINAEAPAALARFASSAGIPLVQVSTDYVFDGESKEPYTETSPVRPRNVYGMTKLGAELAVATLCPHAWILRTSWVFSEQGSNFVKTMLRLGATNMELRVVDDQLGTPTYARHLALAISSLLEIGSQGASRVPGGIYHVTGGPPIAWKGFADEIFRLARLSNILKRTPSIIPIETCDYPTPAVRPLNSVLHPSPLICANLREVIDWRRGLHEALEALARPQTPGR